MTVSYPHSRRICLQRALVCGTAALIGSASGSIGFAEEVAHELSLQPYQAPDSARLNPYSDSTTLNFPNDSNQTHALGTFKLIELIALGLIGETYIGLAASIAPDSSMSSDQIIPQAVTSIFGFSLMGLWPTGISTWLGLAPGLQAQGFGSLDNRSDSNSASVKLKESSRTAVTVLQGGFGNIFGPLFLDGEDHSVSVSQDGTGNLGFAGLITGIAQSIGLSQFGTNVADIALLKYGEDNNIFIDQIGIGYANVNIEGSDNAVTVRQGYIFGLGGDNMVRIDTKGLTNMLNVEQDGDNTLFVSINGNVNNNARNSTNALQILGLSSGDLIQKGIGNIMLIEVQSDENMFGLSQVGAGLKSKVNIEGNMNTTAVLQTGQSSSVSVLQTGTGNTISVSQ